METKDFSLKLKALSEEGAFTGLAAVYSEIDLVGDSILPGAFNKAIADQGKGFPLLWAHRQDEPIGIGLLEDGKAGPLIHGQLLMEDPAAVRAHRHMKNGSMKGLSIGYSTPGANAAEYRDGIRYLKSVRLHEVSLVAIPAAPRAQVLSVKSLNDVRLLLRSIRADEVEADVVQELREIDRELKTLLANHQPEEQIAAVLADLQAFAADLQRIAA